MNKEKISGILSFILRHKIIIIAGIVLFIGLTWLNSLDNDTKENPNDSKNAPAAVRNYTNGVDIDEDGNVTFASSIRDYWDELKSQSNRITDYLSSADELAKLLQATMALDFPDMRKNPDEPIKWEELNADSNSIQGIVKFKRALRDGKTITMTYVTPSEFNEYINKYRETKDEKDKEEALKHFTLEKGTNTSISQIGGKVSSLNGMVFMGDSILTRFDTYKREEMKREGVTLLFKSGCTAHYFLGRQVVSGFASGCKETSDGHFDWNANFQNITNPTGFYLMLGQNYFNAGDRIEQTDELIKKIRSQYPTPPIYISSVLHYIDGNGAAKKSATRFNEELKAYCANNSNNNVYYSDILRKYNDNLRELTESDNDHPNAKGVQVLLDNIKENIIGASSNLEEILKYACSWVGKVPYKSSVTDNDPNGERWMDLKQGRGSDCSHFVHKVFGHFGVMDNSDDGFVRSQNWGKGGDDGGTPGTVKIGTELSKASPGDVIWQNFGDGWHVQIYLGDNKVVECTSDNNYEGVRITKISNNHKIDQILHFSQFPTDTTAYFNPTTGILQSSNSSSSTAINTSSGTTSYTQPMVNTSRSYNNDTLNVDKFINPMLKMSIPDFEHREYRASQSACYDGKYIIHAQNKNFGTVDASSKGGRIAWSNIETGEIDATVEIGAEGGHMDGLAYDSERNMILKVSSSGEGNLLQIDNSTRTIAGHTSMSVYCSSITYLNTTNQLVGVSNNKFIFMKYDAGQNKYVKQSEVNIDNLHLNEALQGIGTDGQVIYIADSLNNSHYSNFRVWTYTLDGKRVEEHKLGEGFDGKSKEVETVISDNQGNLWLICPQGLFRVSNYKANSANVNPRNSSSTDYINPKYVVKVATWSDYSDEVKSNDPEVETYYTRTVDMQTVSIPYQEVVGKFKMPFNYLWTMLVLTNDKEFTFDLADLVKNSKMEITIHDNYNETITVITDNYKRRTDIDPAKAKVQIEYDVVHTSVEKDTTTGKTKTNTYTTTDSTWLPDFVEAKKTTIIPFTKTQTMISKTNTLNIGLTLADGWFGRYDKVYTYNKPTKTENSNSENLASIVEDPETVNGDYGGLKEDIDAKARSIGSIYGSNVKVIDHKDVSSTYKKSVINRTKTTNTTVETSSYVSETDNFVSPSYSTPVTAKTDKISVHEDLVKGISMPNTDASNPQQGFCMVDDQFVVYLILNNSSNTCRAILIDLATRQKCDEIGDIKGHGNTIAYDSVTGDLLAPEPNSIKLIKVNKATRKFENPRRIAHPSGSSDYAMAYNKKNDMFISGRNVYTREAFYSGGGPSKSVKITNRPSGLFDQGCSSFGNQVFYSCSTGYGYGANYIIVCNILTGQQEKLICDESVNGIKREIEECDFLSDGTLVTCYGTKGTGIFKTDYNYTADNSIDKSGVTIGGTVDNISKYNTGGKYTETSSFIQVLSKHYGANASIKSAKELLYDLLEKNEDTKTMVDITRYLIERANGKEKNQQEFEAAIDKIQIYSMNQVGTNQNGTTLSITTTTFTKEQFVQLVQSYSAALSKGSGTKTFRDNAGVVYDVCVRNNVNPVLCAAQAWKEQNWIAPSTSPFNYWGIAVYNGQNYGNSYSGMEAAVENYCKNINQRLKGENGAAKWSKICAQYDNKFTGGINNLYDVLSNWACVDDADNHPAEQAVHASKYVDNIIKIATQIFGEGALTADGGGGDFVAVAEKIWKKICSGNYRYGGSSIPCTGTVDCSSYASWVLYEYGYTEFKGGQHCTKDFVDTNWTQKYGWQEIKLSGGQNPYDSLQPGDLIVRDPGNNKGHITLVVRKENGKIYCYDCGSVKNWTNNPSGNALDKSYMLTDSRPGKVIRVKPKT